MIFKSAVLYLVSFLIGLIVGIFVARYVTPKPVIICPQCPECPAAVKMSSFDLTKLNNKKGNFTYAPTYKDVTIIYQCDSIKRK